MSDDTPSLNVGTRLGFLKARIIEAANAAALETAVNTFLSGFGTPAVKEERFVSMDYYVLAGAYSVCILYTE